MQGTALCGICAPLIWNTLSSNGTCCLLPKTEQLKPRPSGFPLSLQHLDFSEVSSNVRGRCAGQVAVSVKSQRWHEPWKILSFPTSGDSPLRFIVCKVCVFGGLWLCLSTLWMPQQRKWFLFTAIPFLSRCLIKRLKGARLEGALCVCFYFYFIPWNEGWKSRSELCQRLRQNLRIRPGIFSNEAPLKYSRLPKST